MSNQRNPIISGLYKANTSADHFQFSGANHFLRVYEKYLRAAQKYLESTTLEVHLLPHTFTKQADNGESIPANASKPNSPKKEDKADPTDKMEWIYVLDESKYQERKLNQVRTQLFADETRHLLENPSDKWKDSRIIIIDKDEEEGTITFKTQLSKPTLSFEPDTYQIRKQLEAIITLRNYPQKHHLPIISMFSERNSAFQSIPKKNSFLHQIAPNLFPPDPEEEFDWMVLTDESYEGVLEQREFVRKAVNTPDFALLEGPPGSGKTTTIIELIVQLLMKGQRVLLCSATHVAIDNVLDRILTRYQDKCAPWVMPVRIASNPSSIFEESVKPYRLQELIKTKKKELQQFLGDKKRPSQRKMLEYLKETKAGDHNEKGIRKDPLQNLILESANLVAGTSIGILQHPDFKTGNFGKFDVLIVDESSKVTFQEFLVPALHAKKWILVGDVHQLPPYTEEDYIATYLESIVPESQQPALRDLYLVLSQTSGQKRRRDEVIVFFPETHTEAHEELFFDWEKEMGFYIKHLTDNRLNSPDLPLEINAADILICQPSDKVKQYLDKHLTVKAHFINDRPSGEKTYKLQEALRYNPGGRNHSRWYSEPEADSWGQLVAGRLTQYFSFRDQPALMEGLEKNLEFLIPPVYWDQIMEAKRLAFPSILEILQRGAGMAENQRDETVHASGMSEAAKQDRFVSLTFQHRMHPDIASISKKHFYEGKNLNPGKQLANRKWDYLAEGNRVEWVTNQAKGYGKQNRIENHTEAEQIAEELNQFLMEATKPGQPHFEVAVLTFYRHQEAILRKKIQLITKQHRNRRNFTVQNVKITLCTVDRFQGQEADLVLLSFTKTGKMAHYNSPNRLNVALTRARHKLILFGNRNWLAKNASSLAVQDLAKSFSPRLTTKTGKPWK